MKWRRKKTAQNVVNCLGCGFRWRCEWASEQEIAVREATCTILEPNVVAKMEMYSRRCAANSYGMFVHLIVKDIDQSRRICLPEINSESWPYTVNGHSSESEMHGKHTHTSTQTFAYCTILHMRRMLLEKNAMIERAANKFCSERRRDCSFIKMAWNRRRSVHVCTMNWI